MAKYNRAIIFRLFFIFYFLFFAGCRNSSPENSSFKTGLDRVIEYSHLFQHKRVGLITNHTAYNSESKYILDVFTNMPNVKVTTLFGPEHGIRGSSAAGVPIESDTDSAQQIPIYSLYGRTRKPTPEMLNQVDILVYDIQDVGARYFTYISTLGLAMEAAAEKGIPFVVLDRPNPINGIMVEGNILDNEFSSFIGMYPIPVRHGLTVGELARMINEEGWLDKGLKANLTVIPMKNWEREMWYDQTGLAFIKPSPNIPNLLCATVYPGICLLEGTNISEGRGTTLPFLLFGAPWIDRLLVRQKLQQIELKGIEFRDTTFTPISIPGMAESPKYQDTLCSGITIKIIDRHNFEPFHAGIWIIKTIHDLYPEKFRWRSQHFDALCGTDQIRLAIEHGTHPDSLIKNWQSELEKFKKVRRKYLLYN